MVWLVFVSVSNKGFSSWNSMIFVLDTNGFEDDTIKLFTSLQCSILKPDSESFIVVITACKSHMNMELARWSAENLLELYPNESSGYVLMANMYATSGLFEKPMDERILMEEKHIVKDSGCSSLEINGEVHKFAYGRKLYSEFHDIYAL
ncbi:hypothetical protein EJD97_013633, partial [Solanum chilense]